MSKSGLEITVFEELFHSKKKRKNSKDKSAYDKSLMLSTLFSRLLIFASYSKNKRKKNYNLQRSMF